jgi:hypothetical protein
MADYSGKRTATLKRITQLEADAGARTAGGD